MFQSLDGDKTSAPWWKIGESLASAEKDFKQVRIHNFLPPFPLLIVWVIPWTYEDDEDNEDYAGWEYEAYAGHAYGDDDYDT